MVGPLFPDQPLLPTVAMAAAVPTLSWTYKGGQQQHPQPLCPQGRNCFQGHLDVGFTLQPFQMKSPFKCRADKVKARQNMTIL